jgi:hypothetical protein
LVVMGGAVNVLRDLLKGTSKRPRCRVHRFAATMKAIAKAPTLSMTAI